MKWLAKAFIQKMLSSFPKSERLNYFFQKNLNNSFDNMEYKLLFMIDRALIHYNNFIKYNINKMDSESSFFEFGAGWHLIHPIVYYFLGINKQTIIDIKPNIRLDIVNKIIPLFYKYRTKIEEKASQKIRDAKYFELKNLSDLKEKYGIKYLAPCDAANTGLPSGSYDFISNNFVMEHLDRNIINAILEECWRLLKPKGIMSCFIDMNDHYSYFDNSISRYNFLKFNEKQWNWINSSLHHQNRLRYPDYLKLFKQAGFDVEKEDIRWPSITDLKNLEAINLAPEFRLYPIKILGITSLKIVLRKI